MLIQQVLENPLYGLILLVALAFAIGFHEAAHAYTAHWLGDDTPKTQGRLTLNPLNHLDPIGSLFILFAGIGWGRPVFFNPYNLKNPHRDAAIIAFAGPLANIILASLAVLILYVITATQLVDLRAAYAVGFTFIAINIALAIFNLLPIDPLDGFKVVGGLLPPGLARQWYDLQPYGMYILLFLLLTGGIGRIVGPINSFVFSYLYMLIASMA